MYRYILYLKIHNTVCTENLNAFTFSQQPYSPSFNRNWTVICFQRFVHVYSLNLTRHSISHCTGKARIFLLVDLREFFSDLGSGGRKKKALKNRKLSKVNQQSVLNFKYFPKNLDRTISFNS